MSRRATGFFFALLLAACGGGGGDEPCRSPAITSQPPATADAESDWQYVVTAPQPCLYYVMPVTCNSPIVGLQLPPGASTGDNVVYWTPTLDQINMDVPFVIAAAGGSCNAQSFSVHVTPSRIHSFTADRTVVNPGEVVTFTAVFDGRGEIPLGGWPWNVGSGLPFAEVMQHTMYVPLLVWFDGTPYQRKLLITVSGT